MKLSGCQVAFFGGPEDGRDGVLVAPGAITLERKGTTYVPSQTWSDHFKRPTWVPLNHPGQPPHSQFQAA